MEAVCREGLTKNIGVSNIGLQMLREVLNYATIKPAALQIELHPYLVQANTVRVCKEEGLAVMAYSNFGMISYVELQLEGELPSILTLPSVIEIAGRHSKTPGQVVLRWAVQRGTTAIPKS